jgi:carbonic anhydrase
MDLNTFLKSIQEKDEDFIKYNQEFLKNFSKEQHPFITLIECSDSRQDTSFI